MSKVNSKKWISALILGMTSHMLVAHGAADNSSMMGDVSPDQIKSVVKSFSLEAIHVDPNDSNSPISSVVMRGTMFADCAQKFTLTNTVDSGDSSSVSSKGGIGFKMTDPTGEGFACVKSHSGQSCTQKPGAANECVAISTHFGDLARMDLSQYKNGNDKADLKVGLIYTNANNLDVSGGGQFSEVPDLNTGETIEFKNGAQIKAEHLAAAKVAKDERNERNQDIFTNCQDTLDHLPLSQKALAGLKSDGLSIAKYLEMQKQLETKKAALIKAQIQKDLATLHRRVKNVKDLDDADSINDDLTDFAANHTEYEKTIAAYKRELAQNVADLSDTDPAGFQKAHDIVADAAGMDGLNKAQQQVFKNDALRYQIGGMQAQAKVAANSGGNFGITPTTFYGLAAQARDMYVSSCSGKGQNSDSCSEAFQNAKAAVQIPQYYTTQLQQNAALMNQFQSVGQQGYGSNSGMIQQGFGGPSIFNQNAGMSNGSTGSLFNASGNGFGNSAIRFQ